MKKLALFASAAAFALASVSTTGAFAGVSKTETVRTIATGQAKSDVEKVAQKKQQKGKKSTKTKK